MRRQEERRLGHLRLPFRWLGWTTFLYCCGMMSGMGFIRE